MRVSEIYFNHSPTSATPYAMNLRADGQAGSQITAPEWVDGQPPLPVAYVISALAAPVIIKVKLTGGPQNASVHIRAFRVYPDSDGFFASVGPRIGNFATVKKRIIAFDQNGESGEVEFEVMPGWGAGTQGVGITHVTLEWQQIDANNAWTTFQHTEHRLFHVLAPSGSPWTQQIPEPAGAQLPWARALEKACLWAAGAQTIEAAAEAIARKLNSHAKQGYQTASAHIADEHLQLANYLAQLDGSEHFSSNCRDMAMVLAVVVNLLGGNLQLLKITNTNQKTKFKTKRILPLVGSGWVEEEFYRHIVVLDPATVPVTVVPGTVLPAADANAALMYDACLQVNELNQELPVRMSVGHTGVSGYRFELIAMGDGAAATLGAVLPVE